MVNSRMWLVATLLDSADIEHLHPYRKFCVAVLEEVTWSG